MPIEAEGFNTETEIQEFVPSSQPHPTTVEQFSKTYKDMEKSMGIDWRKRGLITGLYGFLARAGDVSDIDTDGISDVPVKENTLEGKSTETKGISRRRVLGLGLMSMMYLGITSCVGRRNVDIPDYRDREDQDTPPERPPLIQLPETAKIKEFKENIEAGRNLRTLENITELDTTPPGVDLSYTYNETVQKIRAIPDVKERIAKAIGYLSVETSKRYSYKTPEGESVYTCNVYALDLLRMMLGHEVIGSRFANHNYSTTHLGGAAKEGEPFVIGMDKWKTYTKADIDIIDSQFTGLDSNNLDWWMENYGRALGWEKVESKEELNAKLGDGYIGVAVTNHKVINRLWQLAREKAQQRGRDHVDPRDYPIGHANVIFSVGDRTNGISQSTTNIEFKDYPFGDNTPKVNPEAMREESYLSDLRATSIWVLKPPR